MTPLLLLYNDVSFIFDASNKAFINEKLSLSCLVLVYTFRAKTLYNVIDTIKTETVGQVYYRHMNAFKTKSAMTLLTIKVGMFVFNTTITIVATYIILQASTAIVNNMYKAMKQKYGQCA